MEQNTRSNTFLKMVERAASIQTGTINAYVQKLRDKHPDASPAEIQEIIDKHYRLISTGSGAGTGTVAAVPGVGTIAAVGMTGVDALFFLEATTWYTLASAVIRGIDINRKEDRMALVLLTISGAEGNDIVGTMVGSQGLLGLKSINSRNIGGLNSRLAQVAFRSVRKRLARGAFAKVLPLGIGAVLGGVVNRRLAAMATKHVAKNLGPAKTTWPQNQRTLTEGDTGSSDANTAIKKAWEELADSE